MAPKPIDYSNTSIYKIQHQDNEELLYVGHTTDFIRRRYSHKNNCSNPNSKVYNCKVYRMIRCNGGWSCFRMIEIKKFPCNNGNEASAEEDRIIREMKANMNSQRAYTGLTKKEYNKQYDIDNKDKFKQWRIDNKDKKRQYDKERGTQQITCGCGAVVCKGNIARHLNTGKHFRWEQNNIK